MSVVYGVGSRDCTPVRASEGGREGGTPVRASAPPSATSSAECGRPFSSSTANAGCLGFWYLLCVAVLG